MMSSRRKSTTPCMVLPSDVVEQLPCDELEGITERTKDHTDGVDGTVDTVPTAEELDPTAVVVPTVPDAGESNNLEEKDALSPSLKFSTTNAPECRGSDQYQQCDMPEEAEADATTVCAISLSKTPIMRMKTKSEPKKITSSLNASDEVVEYFERGVEGKLGGEQEPIEAPLGPMASMEMLLHDSMKLGGGNFLFSQPSEKPRKSSILNPTVIPPGLAQVLSAFQAQQTTAAQPQLLIPLSSIPSYSAAMDTNPLLGGTYKKFPYPSLAEINSLAGQTQFTEEQIKVWFSAQRLKHGVSWTPEEVEEARRKQFNGTVHTVPQTITVIPAHQLSAAANGLQSILQTCQIVGQPGLVFTQLGPGGNLPVTNPITLTVAGLPSQSQSSSRVSCQSTPTNSDLKRATTIQPPSLSPQENSALNADTFSMRPKKSKEQLAELKASYLKNHFVSDAEIARLMNITNLTKGEIKKWFSDTRYNQRNSKNNVIVFHDGGGRGGGGSCSSSANATIVIDSSDETPSSPHRTRTPPVREKETRPKTWNPFPDFTLQKFKEKTPEQLVVLEESFEKSSTPSDEDLSRLRAETKLTRREIDAWFTERRKLPTISTPSPDSSEGGPTDTGGLNTVDVGASCSPSSSRTVSQTPPGGRSKQIATSSSREIKDKTKKTPEQLHLLKSAFVRTQWPTTEEYEQLAEESGLPRPYVVSWFGDSRYSWKNGNLKWFFQYQSGNVEGPNSGGSNKLGSRKRRPRNRGWGRSRTRKQPRRSASFSSDLDMCPPPKKFKSGRDILKEYYLKHRFLSEQDLDELVTKTNMSYERVREWFAEVQRRLDMGADPFQEPTLGRADGGEGADEIQIEASSANKESLGAEMGEDDEDDDEEHDEEDTDDSETGLDAYSSCLDWIGNNNLSIKRDILEGMVRCCTKLGHRDRAMDLVDILSKEASNTCHLTSLLLLKVSVYQHFGAIGPRMLSLQDLCSLLPFNPWNWFNLGKMCVQLLEDNTALEKSTEAEDPAYLAEGKVWLKACTCLIRTRLLLGILQQQQSSFVLRRNQNVLQSAEEALKHLNPKESTLHTLTEVMSKDLNTEKMKEDYQDGESLSSVCLQSFSERWWNHILLTGVLEAEGRDTQSDKT
ncbi:zinc fingers and homeoboxes protein 1-like isoform X1 [Nerophis ophidion]|uniref:zinc fingers and homeoboxes protein 1-like isoform X1 n=2 Tax=Nerophis ophidion TaxID=159077 RepID=UPI002ADF8ACB|nr:zinc fingers and homeoboxes protein 1-like isoform X1 [Nerophis ophidion]XP_061772310.1 zinc fingers and homeoboxes protein 1-like isoform X1 [Nerophis ophidion]